MKNERREKRFGAGGSRLKMEENWKRNFTIKLLGSYIVKEAVEGCLKLAKMTFHGGPVERFCLILLLSCGDYE
jgi:hypothetical protein